jgi:hypothetical protein
MNTAIAVVLAALYAIGLITEASRGTGKRPMVTQQAAGAGAFVALAMSCILASLAIGHPEPGVLLVVGLMGSALFVSLIRMSLKVGRDTGEWSPGRLVVELAVNAAELVGAVYLLTVTL